MHLNNAYKSKQALFDLMYPQLFKNFKPQAVYTISFVASLAN